MLYNLAQGKGHLSESKLKSCFSSLSYKYIEIGSVFTLPKQMEPIHFPMQQSQSVCIITLINIISIAVITVSPSLQSLKIIFGSFSRTWWLCQSQNSLFMKPWTFIVSCIVCCIRHTVLWFYINWYVCCGQRTHFGAVIAQPCKPLWNFSDTSLLRFT